MKIQFRETYGPTDLFFFMGLIGSLIAGIPLDYFVLFLGINWLAAVPFTFLQAMFFFGLFEVKVKSNSSGQEVVPK